MKTICRRRVSSPTERSTSPNRIFRRRANRGSWTGCEPAEHCVASAALDKAIVTTNRVTCQPSWYPNSRGPVAGRRERVLLPTPNDDDIAGVVSGDAGLDHGAHRAADHHFADGNRISIGLHFADAAPHVRIDGQKVRLDQSFLNWLREWSIWPVRLANVSLPVTVNPSRSRFRGLGFVAGNRGRF